VVMHDDGVNGDAVAGDDVYSVLLPPQANRTLVRYRITCADLLGASHRAPFADELRSSKCRRTKGEFNDGISPRTARDVRRPASPRR